MTNTSGQILKEKPCIYTLETGKHEFTGLTWKHQANDLFWIPYCPSCRWIDTKRMIRELSFWQRLRILFIQF